MARRRKYKKKSNGLFSNLNWETNPETMREVSAVILIALGALFILSLFNRAGKIGGWIDAGLTWTFGLIAFFVPVVMILLGFYLWKPDKYELKGSTVIGIVMAFIFIPALFGQFGGVVGMGVLNLLKSMVGQIAAYILIVSFSLVAILLAFNTSIRGLRKKFTFQVENKSVKVHGQNTKPNFWKGLKEKLGFGNVQGKLEGNQQVPVKELNVDQNKVLASSTDTNWEYPPLDLLELSNTKASPGNIAKNVETIEKTLKDFGIDVSMGDVNIGPTVTQYTFKPNQGIKLNQITSRGNDLALALAAHPIRIEAPIPGKSAVGVEVPNKTPAIVTLREILDTDDFKKQKSNLTLALGRDVAGQPMIADLKKMPHLLIAGATGSGKSICINGIISALLYKNSPNDLRLLLVDPKRVEFTRYNDIPHLLTPVITDVNETISMLRWAVAEMDHRFKLFQRAKKRDIISYNKEPSEEGKLPYIVIIIDELADLMAQSAREVEAAIVRLAQMARAVGIHLIVATQRPSVNVITGLIKANITSRIAFATASQVDSRTILDLSGAEKLLGNGDMLYLGADVGRPKRVQGVFIQDKEVNALTNFLKKEGTAQYNEDIINFQPASSGAAGGNGGQEEDSMYSDAKETVVRAGKASASLLQRRLRVGYARAARLLDILESNGVIGPAKGAKPRDVLIGPETLEMEKEMKQELKQEPAPIVASNGSAVQGDESRIKSGSINQESGSIENESDDTDQRSEFKSKKPTANSSHSASDYNSEADENNEN
ncbi:MAG: DNA translocase FtsK 4TM domain-containing protein [Thermoplasmata archaeon]|nr:DNA translocase FtsK 4TM domain-containing protein [Thermoplasmata archaeon]